MTDLAASLEEIINSPTLQWVFVGGKGGVGKTTTSCSLATLLSQSPKQCPETGKAVDRKVLIISTDPAHNLSDAFDQKFSKTPTPVNGLPNLHAMEIDPDSVTSTDHFQDWNFNNTELGEEAGEGLRAVAGIIRQAAGSLPGIDEVTVFAEIMREVKRMAYDTVVFDTAPTGHTLRMLSLPQTLNESVDKILQVDGLQNILQSATQFVSGATGMTSDGLSVQIEKWRSQVREVQQQFADNTKTTFVCVCIPEFLSVYETERLIQELMKYNISCEHVVVNQLVMRPADETPCRMCEARQRIQGKYLGQINELYEDFHVIQMPLHCDEVRGVDRLVKFSHFLLHPYKVETHGYL